MAADLLHRARRSLFLFRRLYTQRLKSVLEYKADFLIMMVAAALVQGLGFVFIWALFRQIPEIHGWGMWDIVLMFALIF
ncbi:MAG TPA: hypothetical protein VML96_05905, partial [Egibacteraceae bacterium]|nr:hypothetical protein [Egibacteraceae bacterium]